MGRTKRKTPEETIPQEPKPKRSRKKAEPPAAVPELEAFDAAREAKSRHVDEPQPESRQENEHPNGPLHERNGQPNPRESVPPFEPTKSHVERHRPNGPRKREVNEAGAIFDGPNLRVTMDADSFMVQVKKPLSAEIRDEERIYLTTAKQDDLVAMGMEDVSDRGNASAWLGPKTAEAKARLSDWAAATDGKYERLGRGR